MKIRENMIVKTAAFLLAMVCFAAVVMLGGYQLANLEVLWGDSDPGKGYAVWKMEQRDYDNIRELIDIYNDEAVDGELNAYSQWYKTDLEERFDPENTNLRWYAVSGDGQVRCGSTDREPPDPALGFFWTEYIWEYVRLEVNFVTGNWFELTEGAVNQTDRNNVSISEHWEEKLLEDVSRVLSPYEPTTAVTERVSADRTDTAVEPTASPTPVTVIDGLSEQELDTVYVNGDYYTDVLMITYDGELYVYGPTVRSVLEANEFGYMWNTHWHPNVNTGDVDRLGSQVMDVYLWLDSGLPVDDVYAREITALRAWRANREFALAVTLISLAAGVALTVFLCVACGHKRGCPGLWLNWFHRIPGDLLLVVFGGAGLLLCFLMFEWDNAYPYWPASLHLVTLGALAASAAALVVGFLVTFTARCKGGTVLKNTVIWRLCAWVGRGCLAILSAIPLIWKVLVLGSLFGFGLLLCRWNEFLLFLLWTLAVALLCLWAYQWGKIRRGAGEIMGGDPDYHIDTRYMLPDLKAHAENLNNLGHAISTAVEDRMRSERFRAELITNVSHDLKTPLTSIINYVDLLKKEPIDDPAVQEYIEVLDRKSQRLKKLTEDLVEASKASTGSMTVIRERIGLVQLADQALAEYADRLAEKRLTVVRAFPEEEVWVEADGRHLWRMLDNLLSNCAKYALEGTRIYLEVRDLGDRAALSVKNISREELNIPPEMLMERFVRGDESRTTEGSGLGLSITQSLTELQNGRFEVSIDGDLFKAIITLPPAESE